jgi:hypothetical protein
VAGWTWFNPLPFRYDQNGVWAAAPDDAWTVGQFGSILHCSRAACVPVPSGTTDGLEDIWGAGANDIWAVGQNGTIVHWNGLAWSKVPSPAAVALLGVSGTSANDVWAGGACGTILHWDGTAWSSTTIASESWPTARQLWAGAPDDVWLMGSQTLLHFDGACWADLSEDLATALVRARFGDAVFDGGSLSISFDRVSGSGAEVWATGIVTTSNEFVGPGAIVHWDGGDRTRPPSLGTLGYRSPYSFPLDAWPPSWLDQQLWQQATSPALSPFVPDGWAVGSPSAATFDEVRRYEGGVEMILTSGAVSGFSGLWGTAPGNIYAVDLAGQVLHFDGAAWRIEATGLGDRTPSDYGRSLRDVWGSRADDLWAVGERIVAHYDGLGWTALADEVGRYRSVWGSSSQDVWAVGSAGIGHWDGVTWTRDGTMTGIWLEEVSGSGPTDVWAVGHSAETWGSGVVLHFDGVSWTHAEPAANLPPLFGVSVLPSGEGWAVGGGLRAGGSGTDSLILHFDGATWSTESLSDGAPIPWLTAVLAVSADEVWAAAGHVLRRSRAGWTEVAAPVGLAIMQIWGTQRDGLWVADTRGSILRFQ